MKSDKSLESLIALDPNKVEAPALKAALEKFHKDKQEEQGIRALQALQSVENSIVSVVEKIRSIRAIEKVEMKRLAALKAAKDTFLKDGDVSKLSSEINGAFM